MLGVTAGQYSNTVQEIKSVMSETAKLQGLREREEYDMLGAR